MLEPAPEDRFQNCKQLIASLKGEGNISARFGGSRFGGRQCNSKAVNSDDDELFDLDNSSAPRLANKAPGTIFKQAGSWGLKRRARSGTLLKKPAGTKVQLTRSGGTLNIRVPPNRFSTDALASGGFAIAWNSFIGVWTFGALAGGGGIAMALFSIPVSTVVNAKSFALVLSSCNFCNYLVCVRRWCILQFWGAGVTIG